jgi:hypothetical protein
MFYGGEINVPGAPGNLMAGNPFGSNFVIDQNAPRRPSGQGPQAPNMYMPTRPFKPGEPGREGAIDVQFRQALGGFSPVGNIGGIAGQIPLGPHTPLPTPGWNPGMIKAPGNPSYRPPAIWEQPGPKPGTTIPWQSAGFSNKTIS